MDILEDQCEKLQAQNTSLLAQLHYLKQSTENLELKDRELLEGKIVALQHELDETQMKNIELALVAEELSVLRDCLKSEFFAVEERVREREDELLRRFCNMGMREKEENMRKFDVGWREKEGFLEEIEVFNGRKEELKENLSECQEKDDLLKEIEDCKCRNDGLVDNLSRGLEVIDFVNVSLMRISEGLKVENVEHEVGDECDQDIMREELSSFEDGLERSSKEGNAFCMKLDLVTKMVKKVEHKMNDYQDKVMKEKKELEIIVASLTEENRDINALLRIALVEKEALEKSLNKLKGSNEEKRMPLLQFAGRSLQRVGFGYFMGGTSNEQQEAQNKDDDRCSDNMASSSSVASDISSECEEEVVSLASAVENLMKNLRGEITHLRRALDESRSDSEGFKSLTEKQAHQIIDQAVRIKELEDQNRTLTQNVDELLIEIKSTEEEVERWREACELEVEAGKRVIQESDKLVAILQQELEKTRAALKVSNSKLKSKEELVGAAMAAQSAAEKSLQLADSRAAGLRERIEVLTRQLEEVGSGEINRSKVRWTCWPWQVFKIASPINADRARMESLDAKQVPPEMQALLQSV